MKLLVTGGCGNMGGHVIRSLVRAGHDVRVLDKDADGLKALAGDKVETVHGDIADKAVVRNTVKGMDAILHLAWSFSESFTDLLDIDVKGYQYLLDAAVEWGVTDVINATTAVSYGKPLADSVDETHPHLVELARSPSYALAKVITEDMSRIYAVQHDMAVNNVMIWYAYGDIIGGRNIRAMVRSAIEQGKIEVPAGCGGSFLQLDDFVSAVLAILALRPRGELFNLGSVYLTWEELAKIIVGLSNPSAVVKAVPKAEWKGSPFLTDDWRLDTTKAATQLRHQSGLTKEKAIADLSAALQKCIDGVRATL
ncbi:MAG: NAD(P)-dependent oxidoreductase [Burkholderiaceae bacterium]|jgi:UDP-glucose 4-epimerase|nr:NAD(P)-dependent oxidoreductase [Burkholderiaceae bacterium]